MPRGAGRGHPGDPQLVFPGLGGRGCQPGVALTCLFCLWGWAGATCPQHTRGWAARVSEAGVWRAAARVTTRGWAREDDTRRVGLGGTRRRRRQAATLSCSRSAACAGGTEFLTGGARRAPGLGSACGHPRPCSPLCPSPRSGVTIGWGIGQGLKYLLRAVGVRDV